MHRGLVHTAAWTMATGAAVTLSWFGVHTVLAGTAYDPPRALPLSDHAPSAHPETDGGVSPRASSTHRPKPSGSPSARPGSSGKPTAPSKESGGSGSGSGGKGTGSGPHPPGGNIPATTSGTVKSFDTAGGRVVLDMGTSSAELVSATPDSGWQMQVWQQNEWIRVDFTGGTGRTSVFCTWNGHPPLVQTDTHA
ncbi:hypothetical protein ADK86_29730 [Streptomyces sp. NRRL F-5755]|uniref:hypothetical protein n=1 Tax=Streptomyces sp. NRRL F-5755 TaxID=1519475 RepID=UPI0006B01ABB|nr:hypothetical protein [Streptomyces sp. NRRL F-5755]KOT89246.1 hypothetical protein ADK86_29730 [Streptomyces sp. NRRL F-5755]